MAMQPMQVIPLVTPAVASTAQQAQPFETAQSLLASPSAVVPLRFSMMRIPY